MPDLLSHYAVAHLAVQRWRRPVAVLFLLGTLLPDLLTRPLYILWPQTYWLVMPLHTPVGFAIMGWMIAALFPNGERRSVFWALLLGALLHFSVINADH